MVRGQSPADSQFTSSFTHFSKCRLRLCVLIWHMELLSSVIDWQPVQAVSLPFTLRPLGQAPERPMTLVQNQQLK